MMALLTELAAPALSAWEVWDRAVVVAVNQSHTPWLDVVMHTLSARFVWVPLYLLWFGLLARQFRWEVWKVAVLLVLLIVLTDQTTNLLKAEVPRLRPCYEPALAGLHLPDGCGGQWGFASSHAANTLGLAAFFTWIASRWQRRPMRWPRWVLPAVWIWAVCVSLSRVYLAAHYPTDVVRGWLVGLLAAGIVAILFGLWLPKQTTQTGGQKTPMPGA